VSYPERAQAYEELTRLLLIALASVQDAASATEFGRVAAKHVARFASSASWFSRTDFYDNFKDQIVSRGRTQLDVCEARYRSADSQLVKDEAMRELDRIGIQMDACKELATALGVRLVERKSPAPVS
jgi:ABC-type amino acid transport substrate-binding protein